MAWLALLDGELRDRAATSVEEIVASLPEPDDASLDDPSLAGGASGLAILCDALARAGLDDGENARAFLDRAIALAEERILGGSLYSGVVGVAWAIEHLGNGGDSDANAHVDAALFDALADWRGSYDVVSGIVGLGVYALERLGRPSALAVLARAVSCLGAHAERNGAGVTWFTSARSIPNWQHALFPDGYYNLGLAHGVPGVMAFLAEAARAGVDAAGPLVDGAVAWLLAQKLPLHEEAAFANWVGGEPQRKLAWCYGELGVAAALFHAARCTQRDDWEAEALGVARRAALRPPERTGVIDAGLCHGAAGVAHVFNRLFQATGGEELRDAARSWYALTLDMRRPGSRYGGYVTRIARPDGGDVWTDDFGLLAGASGIALALLAATTDVEPEWDRMLLLSEAKKARQDILPGFHD